MFKKDNQWWKTRSKNGRDKLLSSPELLWEAACEYFQSVVENPFVVEDFVGKDADRVFREKTRPFTWAGLELYLDISSLRNYKTTYPDFLQVITRIENVMSSQKFEGAAAGVFNANIIARDLGLRDSSDVTSNGSEIKQVFVIGGKEIEF